MLKMTVSNGEFDIEFDGALAEVGREWSESSLYLAGALGDEFGIDSGKVFAQMIHSLTIMLDCWTKNGMVDSNVKH